MYNEFYHFLLLVYSLGYSKMGNLLRLRDWTFMDHRQKTL